MTSALNSPGDPTTQFKTMNEASLLALLDEMPQLATGSDSFGVTPLMIACSRHQSKLVGKLLELGSDATARDWSGNPALVWALKEHNGELVSFDRSVFEYLASHGADLNDDDDGSITPLMMACAPGKHEMMGWLVELGADLGKEIPKEEMTVLQYACFHGMVSALDCLLTLGVADVAMTAQWLREEMDLDAFCGEQLKTDRIACLATLLAHELSVASPLAASHRTMPRL